MRGKLQSFPGFFRTPRITPAHAGKTENVPTETILWTDHPRACGENVIDFAKEIIVDGSPPRMRGKLEVQREVAL